MVWLRSSIIRSLNFWAFTPDPSAQKPMWEGHVAIIDYSSQLSAVVIDNPTIYDTFVAWFEMMWGTNESMAK